jgi:hypothetical protein
MESAIKMRETDSELFIMHFTNLTSRCLCSVIGMGRPFVAEPYLARDLIAGTSHRARPNEVPLQLTVVAAFAQISQRVHGNPVWDYSREEDVRNFLETMPKDQGEGAHEGVHH